MAARANSQKRSNLMGEKKSNQRGLKEDLQNYVMGVTFGNRVVGRGKFWGRKRREKPNRPNPNRGMSFGGKQGEKRRWKGASALKSA